MPALNEPKRYGEFIGEMAMGIGFHAELGTLITGQNLSACTVVGQITASGKFTILAPAANDGSQNAAAILVGGKNGENRVNATSADKSGLFFKRGPAQVNLADLVWPAGITDPQKAAAIAQLLALGIKAA